MPFIQTTEGLAFEDPFDRPNSATVGNDWDETVRGQQLIQILNNELSSNNTNSPGIEEIYQPGDSLAVNPIPTGDTICQINADYGNSNGHRVQMMLRTDEGVAGTGSEDSYLAFLDKNTFGEEIQIHNVIGGVSVQNVKVGTLNPTTTIRGIRFILKDEGSQNVLTCRISGVLSSLADLTKDFDAAVATMTDSTAPIPASGDTTDFAILTLRNQLMDRYILMGRDIVINTVPTGWKVSIDNGVTKVAEVAGTVTLDVDTAFLPRTTMKAYNAADVQKDAFSGLVYGGSVFDFRRYPEDAMITGVFR